LYDLGASIEIIHNFTLVHDDIMDNDERQKKVIQEILRVCEMDEKKLKDICFNLLPKVQYNQKVLFEHDSIEEFAGFLKSITND